VLTGRVTKAGDKIQISTELVKTEDGSHIWGKRYSGQAADLLALQQEIAGDVSQRLQPRLSVEQKQKLSKAPTDNPEAYQLYVKGRYFFDRWSPDGRSKAVEYFQQAIAKDPGFAAAYAGLAYAFSIRGFFGESGAEEMAQGMAAARKALTLDSSVAEAHAALGLALMLDLRWKDSEDELRGAITLNPNCSICHFGYAVFLSFTSHAKEAIAEIKKTQALDPMSFLASSAGGEVYYFARDYDEAIQQHKIAIEMDPSNPTPYGDLGDTYYQKGMCSEAVKANSRSEELQGHAQNAATLRKVLESGDCRAAWGKQRDFYADPANPDYFPMSAAILSSDLEEKDQAFKFLEMAYQTRQGIIWLKAEPQLDNIRSDPRYFEMLKRIGLADGAPVTP